METITDGTPLEMDRPMSNSNRKNQTPIRTQFRRYECKYLITEELAAAIRSYAAPYLEPDPYTAASSDKSYDITSLYLDTPDLKLFRETEDGLLNRVKLRIRSYDESAESPVFLEIKRRFDRLVLKGRSRIDRDSMAMILAGGAPLITGLDGNQNDCYAEFIAWVDRWLARPVAWVRYRREAYVGTINSDIRITMDRNLRCAAAGFSEIGNSPEWLPVETQNVVLEIKFDDSYPDWVAGLIRRFRLDRTSYSKYGNSVRGLAVQTPSPLVARAMIQ